MGSPLCGVELRGLRPPLDVEVLSLDADARLFIALAHVSLAADDES